jgi:hypothetical protein
MEAVDAGWLRIQSMRLGGAKLSDCLKEAYDHHAGLFAKAGEPLSETVLNLTIPVLVFSEAIHHKWIPYPLIRPVGERVVDNFLEDVHEHFHSDCELVPEQELTETFGGYKVTSGYESQFRRVEHWRAEGFMRAMVGDSQNSEPAGDIGQEARNSAPPQSATVKDGTVGPQYRTESWQAIEISFLSDERIQIRCGPQIETRNSSCSPAAPRRTHWLKVRPLLVQLDDNLTNCVLRTLERTRKAWRSLLPDHIESCDLRWSPCTRARTE